MFEFVDPSRAIHHGPRRRRRRPGPTNYSHIFPFLSVCNFVSDIYLRYSLPDVTNTMDYRLP